MKIRPGHSSRLKPVPHTSLEQAFRTPLRPHDCSFSSRHFVSSNKSRNSLAKDRASSSTGATPLNPSTNASCDPPYPGATIGAPDSWLPAAPSHGLRHRVYVLLASWLPTQRSLLRRVASLAKDPQWRRLETLMAGGASPIPRVANGAWRGRAGRDWVPRASWRSPGCSWRSTPARTGSGPCSPRT